MLFLHGGGVSGWMWRATLNRLGSGVRSIVPDLPGHGSSDQVDYVSHAETVSHLAALLRDRAPGGAVVVGFSLGGQLALLLAAEHPELVRGVVIVSAETKPAPAPRATLALLKLTAPLARRRWFAELQAKQLGVPDADLDHYVRDSRAMTPATLLASVGENITFTLPGSWSSFPGPATVIVGERERGLMRASATLTHDALPGSRLVVADDVHHDAPFTRPALIATEVAAIVAASAAGASE